MADVVSIEDPVQTALGQVLQGIEQFAEGRLDHRISLDGPAAVSQLALSLNNMALRLESRMEQLLREQEKLEKRVQELDRRNGELGRIDTGRREFCSEIGQRLRTPVAMIRDAADEALRESAKAQTAALREIAELSRQTAHVIDDWLPPPHTVSAEAAGE